MAYDAIPVCSGVPKNKFNFAQNTRQPTHSYNHTRRHMQTINFLFFFFFICLLLLLVCVLFYSVYDRVRVCVCVFVLRESFLFLLVICILYVCYGCNGFRIAFLNRPINSQLYFILYQFLVSWLHGLAPAAVFGPTNLSMPKSTTKMLLFEQRSCVLFIHSFCMDMYMHSMCDVFQYASWMRYSARRATHRNCNFFVFQLFLV